MSVFVQVMAANELDMNCDLAQVPKMDLNLQRILTDANVLIQWINNINKSFKTDDPHILQEVIVSLGYRLIRFQALRLDTQIANKLEATIHIGLIAFLTTLFLQAGGRRFLKYGLVARCIRDIVDGISPGKGELQTVEEESQLWLLFIGGISVLQETAADRAWSVLQIQHLIKSMGIESWTWTQLRRQLLGRFPWIGYVHDQPGKALWEEAILEPI